MENPWVSGKDSDSRSAALTYGKALHPIKIEIERDAASSPRCGHCLNRA
jgi:hypothetical protein